MKRIKRLFASVALMAMLGAGSASATGWPANYQGVMLQGFYWDSYAATKWTNLTSQADELSQFFKLIWIPQSAKSASNPSMGYDPVYWFTNYTSAFGNEQELRNLIKTYKGKGVGIIADVVINHRSGVSNWTNFPSEQWNGQTWHIGLDGICSTDEVNRESGQQHGTGAPDTGEDFGSARDLDHTNANVQNNCKNYCKFLLDDLGYVGFRLDMVKGYGGQYTKIYNQYSKPQYCVGEYWDGNYDAVAGWIEATGKESAAFDFPMKYQINKAFSNNDMQELAWAAGGDQNNYQPAGLVHYGYNQYSVTFVDNHDTYRDGSKFTGDVVAANAFILCSPGTPCVFLPHWTQYKKEISALINIRNSVGLSNTSAVKVLKRSRDCYMAEVTGTKGKLVVRIGSSQESPSGYSSSDIKASGSKYCVWSKSSIGGGNVDVPEIVKPTGAYTVYYDNTSTSWTQPQCYYFKKDAETQTSTWPGEAMTKVEGNIWKFNVPAGNDYVIFNNIKANEAGQVGSNQTDDLEGSVNGLYTMAGFQGTYKNGGGSQGGGNDDPIIPGDYPEKVYIVGNLGNGHWATAHAIAPNTIKNGVYIWKEVEFVAAPAAAAPASRAGEVEIYFDNTNTSWTTPYIHYWGGTESTWPGVAMQKVEGNIWKYSCPAGTTGCLFNAGDGDATKTSDFVAVSGHIYTSTGDTGKTYSGGGNQGGGNTSTGSGYFTFLTALDNEDGEWDGANQADRYGAPEEDCVITIGQPTAVRKYANQVDAMGAKSWKHNAPGKYGVVLNLRDMTVGLYHPGEIPNIEDSISIIEIDNENAPVMYFDLQGRRVLNPERGMYIRVCGNKVTKIIL